MTSTLTLSRYDAPEDLALIELMIRRINSASAINIGAAILIGVVALFAPFWKALLAIMACRLLVASASAALGKAIGRRMLAGQPVVGLLNLLCLSIFIGGMTWAGILIVVPLAFWSTPEILSLATLVSVGVTVVTIITSPVRRAMWSFYSGFSVTIGIYLAMNLAHLGSLPYVWAGVTVLTSGLAIRISRDIRRTVELDAENRRMADTLSHLNEELGGALDRADRLARYDQLTGVRNRRAFEEEAGSVAVRRDADDRWYTMLVDLDHFKSINDEHGHFIGDEVLRRVGAIMIEAERHVPHTVSARMGGEEFVLLMPGRGEAEVVAAAEAIRRQIELLQIDGGHSPIATSASFGLAEWRLNEPIHAALRRADIALYQAKETGRNRIVSATAERDAGGAIRAA